jgi:WhiB family redox-sensing transcriptional regulator
VSIAELFTHRDWEPQPWAKHARCHGVPDLFFPVPAERPQARLEREAAARVVCESCAVMTECRSYARRHHEYGFWGGESEEERHAAGYRLIAPIGVRARSAS